MNQKRSKKRILLMYISDVSGHHRATLAIERALKRLDSEISLLNINSFNYTNPISERIVNRLYMGIIKQAPQIWEYLYDNPKIVKSSQKIKELIHRFNSRKLKLLYDSFRPQVIVCTQAFPCGMVADFKKTYQLDIPLLGVMTDYYPHSYWLYPTVNFYIVASEEAKKRLILKGVPKEKIKILGIPIDPKFIKRHSQEDLAKKLDIDLKTPRVLIMGGGQGLGPIKDIVLSLDKLKEDFQLLVVAGINKKLVEWLKKRKVKLTKKIYVFEYVDNVDELMEASSLIITKAGGLTTAEALAKAKPLVVINPIPGQEANNTDYLLKKGAGLKVRNASELRIIVKKLLNDKNLLSQMSKNASFASKPLAAIKIAELILDLCKENFKIVSYA